MLDWEWAGMGMI